MPSLASLPCFASSQNSIFPTGLKKPPFGRQAPLGRSESRTHLFLCQQGVTPSTVHRLRELRGVHFEAVVSRGFLATVLLDFALAFQGSAISDQSAARLDAELCKNRGCPIMQIPRIERLRLRHDYCSSSDATETLLWQWKRCQPWRSTPPTGAAAHEQNKALAPSSAEMPMPPPGLHSLPLDRAIWASRGI